MKCKIDGCNNDAMYKKSGVCQKHYFRFNRYGTYELTRKRKYRNLTPNGYYKIYEPDHFLADSNGDVFEHRYVYSTEISSDVSECELCGDSISWDDCHIDHIDEDKTNNKKENLRALCRSCNVYRGHSTDTLGRHFFTANGKTLTAAAWARQPGVKVAGRTIIVRRMKGMNDYDAIFSERKTCKSVKTKVLKTKYDVERGIKELK